MERSMVAGTAGAYSDAEDDVAMIWPIQVGGGTAKVLASWPLTSGAYNALITAWCPQ